MRAGPAAVNNSKSQMQPDLVVYESPIIPKDNGPLHTLTIHCLDDTLSHSQKLLLITHRLLLFKYDEAIALECSIVVCDIVEHYD